MTEATAEVERAREVLGLCGQFATALMGRSLPFEDAPRGTGWRGWYRRRPVGVVAAITPFNDPLNLVVDKLGPALVAGNPIWTNEIFGPVVVISPSTPWRRRSPR